MVWPFLGKGSRRLICLKFCFKMADVVKRAKNYCRYKELRSFPNEWFKQNLSAPVSITTWIL